MSASFPGSAKTFTSRSAGQVIASAHVNDLQDEVAAVESCLLGGTSLDATLNSVTLSAGKVVFPAVQSASTNANTLDDYEEGTWVPVIGGAGGTGLAQAYTNQEGCYTKVGKLVTASFFVTLSNKDTITGVVQIQGLPFAAENGVLQFYQGSAIVFTGLATNWTNITAFVNQNTTAASVVGVSAAASGVTNLGTADIGNTTAFRGTFSYRAAS